MNESKKQCPHCKSEISSDATRCPQCQGDLRNWFVRHKIISAVLGIIVVLLIAGQYARLTTKKEDAMPYSAAITSRVYVKQILKAPATAEFPATNYDKITHDISDKNLYEVTSYVDSENGFGAKVRSNWTIRLKYIGGDPEKLNNWQLVMLVFDDKLMYPPQSQ